MLGSLALAGGVLVAPVGVHAELAGPTIHVVQPGETLSQIALDAGIDGATLASLNGLDDPNLLIAGQALKLPGAPSLAPKTYTVGEGDTLWAIAQQFNTTIDALVQLNSLEDAAHLRLGTVLSLPSGAAPSPARAPAPTAASASTPAPVATATPGSRHTLTVTYTVQSGDTLSRIAKQFDVRAAVIAEASGLDDPNRLSTNSVLKVPVPGKEHVVSDGETLRDIAATEKVDLGSLIDFNQLDDPGLIRVGQVLVLPVPASPVPAASAASAPAATSTAAPVATAAPSATATPPPVGQVAAAAPAQATPKPAPPKPSAPLVIAARPPGAPTDGLAGAGLKLLGSPYVWGGSDPRGFDCSGFVWYVARQASKSVSRGMLGEYNGGSHPPKEELKAGDLVFFQNTFSPGLSHNGIYIGNNQFVHAADEAAGVTVSSLNSPYWSSHWFGATRLP